MLACIAAAPAATAQAEPADDLLHRERPTGDWGGLRTDLSKAGLEIGLEYFGETLGVAAGGARRGWIYEGLLELELNADLEKLVGWKGATAHAEALQIHGRGPSAHLVGGNLLDVSNIEALPATRLYTLWVEQSLFDDRASLRAGQIDADDEFLISDTAAHLLNGTFGWAAIASANMTSGGPAYPLPDPGVRLRFVPVPAVTVLAAVFSGDPAGHGCTADPQVCDQHGTTFSFSGGALWMGEVQYAVNRGEAAAGLPGVYKIGGWYETGDFADQRLGVDSMGTTVSLADPTATGPLIHHGNFGLYAIADQMVWREAGSKDQGLTLFGRIGGTLADRNLVSFYADGGLGYKGPFGSRDDDMVALGVAYARISPDAADFDRDARAADPTVPVRDYEMAIELTYIAALAPWWSLQADLQCIVHPGGNVQDPNNPSRPIEDALVLGLRTAIAF